MANRKNFLILAILLGLAGAAILILKGGGVIDFTSNHQTGNLFVFINASSYALYLVILKYTAD